ncbi:proline--tRNA ligase [Oenococcus kitaharae]|uniref:Proline--tRNA ligase n=1 Tax=Oenococcus kitaharae DSM 17330 TaxID=1045004 RepID=G9WH60_9LACO|nr:proline--tRNA ligase [Oenococcus kitaharae]EHN59549.1 Prolyl-tRNA synthetase [Oenococcus kitaharae DSM 17330]OEY83402.1 prolyl-tRNA synthetase [Oenococcus kitaharae]OEY85201.1 prolyl-tRNA synthetase [Oenococcus kitaharae]OEY86055.1 prolyl-tRNA synthetase [Oenococcus kitaharae]
MKQSKMFIPTEKEVPSDAQVQSHILMLRAGFIRQLAGGIFAYLPLADRVINKIEAIIRQEMDKIDANEMLMPEMIPAELWKSSGRFYTYGPQMYQLKDRQARDFIMAPTHEETFTRIFADEIKSYKKLPLIVYQIQQKFRDELRPKNGLLRGREFIMKDAYSFSADQAGLDQAYDAMEAAYKTIFKRVGLNYREIIADAGDMGGKASAEFQAIADTGEDVIAYSDQGNYAANIEMAETFFESKKPSEAAGELHLVDTPNTRTVTDDAQLLQVSEHKIAKMIVFKADEQFVAVLLPGDDEVNEIKVKNFLNADSLVEANEKDVFQTLGAHFGSLGPIGADSKLRILVDRTISNEANWFVGANQDGKHYANFNLDRDLTNFEIGSFRTAKEGDLAPDGKGKLVFTKGIEIGHIFKLGTFYTSKMGGQIQNDQGKLTDMIMGSYGIGVSRLLSAISEQSNDDKGFIWPKAVAPFDVHVIIMNTKDATQQALSAQIETEIQAAGFEVLVDDRKERPGVKFADSDLIGIPIRVVVGRDAPDKLVEVKARSEETSEKISVNDLVLYLKNKFSELK